jgi:hypothetical protein
MSLFKRIVNLFYTVKEVKNQIETEPEDTLIHNDVEEDKNQIETEPEDTLIHNDVEEDKNQIETEPEDTSTLNDVEEDKNQIETEPEDTSTLNDLEIKLEDISNSYREKEKDSCNYENYEPKPLNYSITNSIERYKTNLSSQLCECKNWLEQRHSYKINDPRRFCKHLISLLDISSLRNELLYYKEDFQYYKKNEKGYRLNFETIIDIPNTTHKILFNYENDWMSLLTINGLKYGILFNEYNNIYWTKKDERPIDYTIVEIFLLNLMLGKIHKLNENERNEIQKHLKTIVINFFKKEQSKDYIIYGMDWDSEKSYDDGYKDYGKELYWNNIVVNNIDIFVNLNGKNFIIKRNTEINTITHKNENENELKILNENHIWYEKYRIMEKESIERKEEKNKEMKKVGYIPTSIEGLSYRENIDEFLSVRDDIFGKFVKLSRLSKVIGITSNKINKSLIRMNMIEKNKEYNIGNYIFINDGLKYGINFERNSEYSHILIPEWYKVHFINENSMSLEENKSRKNIKLTDVYFDLTKSKELTSIIKKGIDLLEEERYIEKGTIEKKKVSTSPKTKLREEWIKDRMCKKCNSTNLHKKGVRGSNGKSYQRYQCMDCKSMFKEEIK